MGINPKIHYWKITDFTHGLDVLTDPRRLPPNSDKDGTAGSPDMLNMDITKNGSLITSPGFELVGTIGGATGGIQSLLAYDKDTDNRYLIMSNDDDYYSITPSNSTPSNALLGDYGDVGTFFGGVVYLSAAGTRKAILGTDVTANTIKKADLSGAMASVAGAPPDGYIMETFMGRLFVASAGSSTLYYTNVDDEDDWAGGGEIKFNDIITGLKVEGQRLIVFTRTYHQAVQFEYDSNFLISTPVKESMERRYGALSHKAITRTGSNIRYWADDNRVYNLGAENGYDDQGIPRSIPLSRNIDPALNSTNISQRRKAVAVEFQDQEQWWLAVPNGTSQYNSLVYVYNENFNSWSARYGFYPADMTIFRDSDYSPRLYWADALSPSIYRFNSDYSYDGEDYLRRWRSKKFTMGDSSLFKEWRWIDISGSMYAGTQFVVRITVDNSYKEYQIDNTHLVIDAFGEYIGDVNIGDSLIGGSEPSESAFKRFKAHIPIDTAIREGFEMELLIYNDGAEQPWKIDEIGIEFSYRPKHQRKQSFINNNQLP